MEENSVRKPEELNNNEVEETEKNLRKFKCSYFLLSVFYLIHNYDKLFYYYYYYAPVFNYFFKKSVFKTFLILLVFSFVINLLLMASMSCGCDLLYRINIIL